MARHELLESILKAQFELEYAEPKDLPACRDRLNQLVDSAIAGRHFTRTAADRPRRGYGTARARQRDPAGEAGKR